MSDPNAHRPGRPDEQGDYGSHQAGESSGPGSEYGSVPLGQQPPEPQGYLPPGQDQSGYGTGGQEVPGSGPSGFGEGASDPSGYGRPGTGSSSYGQPWTEQPPYVQPGYEHPGYSQGGPGQAAGDASSYPPGYGPPGYDAPVYGQQLYSTQPYGQPGYPQGGQTPAVWTVYGTWGKRVGAYLIDFLPALLGQLIFFAGYLAFVIDVAQSPTGEVTPTTGGALTMLTGMLIGLVALVWQIYNRWVVAGRTGQSLGKRVFRLSLVSEETGQPVGPLNAFLRDLVHILDSFFYIGFLWPLWDEKRQTLSDKVMKTVVLDKV